MKQTSRIAGLVLALVMVWTAAFNPITSARAAGTCALTAGQVLINEILPSASGGVDWVELYNTTGSMLDISYCYIDDIAGGGGAPIQIAAGTTIPAYGFWTMDKSSYFNNTGDDVRLLLDNQTTILDTYTYPSTAYDVSWYRLPDGGTWAGMPTSSPTKGATNGTVSQCGTGTWVPGRLEIHHINIGQGDSTLIVGPTGQTVLFDAGESYWNSSADAQTVGAYIQGVLGCKELDYVVISHFHVDHIGYVGYGGLWNLVEVQGFTVGQTLLRDTNTYMGTTSGTYDNWSAYLAGAGQTTLHPILAVEGTGQVNLGSGVTFKIVTVDGNGAIIAGNFSANLTPPSENDYSIGAVISYGAFDEWLGGDLDGQFYLSEFGYTYHDVELSVAREVGDVDVYRVNHHGSDHSNNATFVNQLDPEVSIISVGNDNTYGHPRQTVMDLLLATSDVYLTERGDLTVNIGSAVVAGNIVVATTDGTTYTVNGIAYTATEPVRTDADGDGYFAEVDPVDTNALIIPAPNGGCDPLYQVCTVTTNWMSPTAQVADTGGDKNGYESNPAYAFSNNAAFAVDLNSGTTTSTSCTDAGKDRHRFYNLGFAIPANVTVSGLEIQLHARADSTSGTPKICVQVSWDGGLTWTTTRNTPSLATTETAYILGGSADNWGHAWTPAEFNNGSFIIRVIDVSSSTSRDFYLDWIAARVTYK
jgi:beta-lactamase superfamily II metal-dependent hydrolase